MRHVIIGAGAAGITAAAEIRLLSPKDEITVISTEKDIHSRCMLHYYISGKRTINQLSFVEDDFIQKNNINHIIGQQVQSLKLKEKQVVLSGGQEIYYDKLLIATGANSFIPPVGDLQTASNVFGLRHLSDAVSIKKMAESATDIVVIGAGLVGMDAAYGLLELNKNVTVVEMAKQILPLQLDSHAAKAYEKLFKNAGCEFMLEQRAVKAQANSQGIIKELELDSGEKIKCDMIIVTAGVRPAIGFLQESTVAVDKCVTVDDCMKTNNADVFAAGDVTNTAGIWPNAMKQGKVAARNMCGKETHFIDKYSFKNTINFFGLASMSVGVTQIKEGDEVFICEDKRTYKKAAVRDGRLIGVLLQGNIDHAGIYQYLIKNKVDISKAEKSIFSLSFADFYAADSNGAYTWL